MVYWRYQVYKPVLILCSVMRPYWYHAWHFWWLVIRMTEHMHKNKLVKFWYCQKAHIFLCCVQWTVLIFMRVMDIVTEWVKKLLHTLNWYLRTCAVGRARQFCTIIRIIFIANSLCSLEHDLLYIVEFLCVFLQYQVTIWPNFIVCNSSFEMTGIYLPKDSNKKKYPNFMSNSVLKLLWCKHIICVRTMMHTKTKTKQYKTFGINCADKHTTSMRWTQVIAGMSYAERGWSHKCRVYAAGDRTVACGLYMTDIFAITCGQRKIFVGSTASIARTSYV